MRIIPGIWYLRHRNIIFYCYRTRSARRDFELRIEKNTTDTWTIEETRGRVIVRLMNVIFYP